MVLPVYSKPKDNVVQAPNLIPYVSVIKRAPNAASKTKDRIDAGMYQTFLTLRSVKGFSYLALRLPERIVHQEPEQDEPIDYHIPKRKEGETEESDGKNLRRPGVGKVLAAFAYYKYTKMSKYAHTVAAAGHGM